MKGAPLSDPSGALTLGEGLTIVAALYGVALLAALVWWSRYRR
jgi:hypothetical protein